MFEARFQSFENPGEGAATGPRVAALRAELVRRGLAGFIVPHADRHQNEYLPPSEQRLAWLTGFTGSAGVAIVLADRAAIFVDGRYTLQVRDQVDQATFEIRDLVEGGVPAYLDLVDRVGRAFQRHPAIRVSLYRITGSRPTNDGLGRTARVRQAIFIDVVEGDREGAVQLSVGAQVGHDVAREFHAPRADDDNPRHGRSVPAAHRTVRASTRPSHTIGRTFRTRGFPWSAPIS